MATRHSSRRRPSGRAGRSRRSIPPSAAVQSAVRGKRVASAATDAASKKKKATRAPDLDEILGHFSDALALAECAHSALDAAQQGEGVGRAIGAAVVTLERGLRDLLHAYTELDHAIQRQS